MSHLRMYEVTISDRSGQTRSVLAKHVHWAPGVLHAAIPAPGGLIHEQYRTDDVVSVRYVRIEEPA